MSTFQNLSTFNVSNVSGEKINLNVNNSKRKQELFNDIRESQLMTILWR